jgi:plasmid stability protein
MAAPNQDDLDDDPAAATKDFTLRLPARLAAPLNARARRHYRSLSGEILAIIDQTLQDEGTSTTDAAQPADQWGNLLRLQPHHDPRRG